MKDITDFLAGHDPYDRLGDTDLQRLAATVEVEYFASGTTIVEAKSPTLHRLFVVRAGAVEIVDGGLVVDVLGPGDTFGHISVFSGQPPPLTVRATEDTLCYLLDDPRQHLEHPERLSFSYYGTQIARDRLISSGGTFSQLERPIGEVMHPITWCQPGDAIRDVARRMTDDHRSCAVFLRGNDIGIVTDDDFRRRVVTGEVPIDARIDTIASLPALVMPADRTVGAAYLFIFEHGIHHLIVVDGATGHPIGVARIVDMVATEVRHPLVIRTSTGAATDLPQLRTAARMLNPTLLELWGTGVPAQHFGALLAAMLEAIFIKAISLTATTAPLPELECAWMLLGSVGRREPLPNSDVDTALAWVPRASDRPLPARVEVSAATEPVMRALEECGLRTCPQGLNASFPLFNRSAGEWRQAAEHWRQNPDDADNLLMASTMLDARPVTRAALTWPLRSALTSAIGRGQFTRALTQLSIASRPPRGFVRGFVADHFGEQKNRLNIKKAGMRPIVSLAQALALQTGDLTGSTTDRLDRARQAGLLNVDDAESLKTAFTLCYQLSIDYQMQALRDGRPIDATVDPTTLDTLERRHLRDAFRVIAAVQDKIASDGLMD
ncbi:putative nucleotidyltransferase substrate binding domain-containing protein [Mycobacterium sp. 155]|uniref:putative nucleotidyltransferase substrate binding domain-containing protein n=1 Tax=Mycobacterium sp. 155 TaxID=1157943 RepID=UPI0003615EAE|nr:putative nucleotidyltransferase substrate binding domain-containing protein [Mycobacterium sp. 155]